MDTVKFGSDVVAEGNVVSALMQSMIEVLADAPIPQEPVTAEAKVTLLLLEMYSQVKGQDAMAEFISSVLDILERAVSIAPYAFNSAEISKLKYKWGAIIEASEKTSRRMKQLEHLITMPSVPQGS
jgi:hypothetical protein